MNNFLLGRFGFKETFSKGFGRFKVEKSRFSVEPKFFRLKNFEKNFKIFWKFSNLKSSEAFRKTPFKSISSAKKVVQNRLNNNFFCENFWPFWSFSKGFRSILGPKNRKFGLGGAKISIFHSFQCAYLLSSRTLIRGDMAKKVFLEPKIVSSL